MKNDLVRKITVEACDGCNKEYTPNGIESFCLAYADPSIIHRKGCFLKSNKEVQETKKKKINPLKASKRARRKG